MYLAADSNMGFHQDVVFSQPFYNQHVVSFQSGGVNSRMREIPGMMNGLGGLGGTAETVGAAGASVISSGSPASNSVPGLKYNTGLAVDWSLEEIAILKAGLIKYANKPNITRYVKIAAMLPDKTARDVALRCRWMFKENGKRHKVDKEFAGKKIKDTKDKMVDCSLKANKHLVPLDSMAAYAYTKSHANLSNQVSSEVPLIYGATRRLLDENAQILSQIAANLATFQLQDNIDHFCRSKNNIAVILSSMNTVPGIMSQMPPLPVMINEGLVSSILPSTHQVSMFGCPSGINLKQEPLADNLGKYVSR